MTRQRLAQIRNAKAGWCEGHKGRPIHAAGMCLECWRKTGSKHSQAELAARFDQIKDWRVTDEVIAEAVGIKAHSVRHWRKRFAPETVGALVALKWADVDWTQDDRLIAYQKNKSVNGVRKARERYSN